MNKRRAARIRQCNRDALAEARKDPVQAVERCLQQIEQLRRWTELDPEIYPGTANLARKLIGKQTTLPIPEGLSVRLVTSADLPKQAGLILLFGKHVDLPDEKGGIIRLLSGTWSQPQNGRTNGQWRVDRLPPDGLPEKITRPDGACWIPDEDPFRWVVDALDNALVTSAPSQSALSALMPFQAFQVKYEMGNNGLFQHTPSAMPYSRMEVVGEVEQGELDLRDASMVSSVGHHKNPQLQLLPAAEHEDVPVTAIILPDEERFPELRAGRGARPDKRLLYCSCDGIPYDLRRPGGRHRWEPTLDEVTSTILWVPSSGKAPYAIRVSGDRIRVALNSLDEVRHLLHTLRAREGTWRRVADALNRGGYRTRRGEEWTVKQAQRIAEGRSSYQPKKHSPALLQAFDALSLARIILPDGRNWRPVLTRAAPNPCDPDSKAVIEIELPPDAPTSGVRILREPLLAAGMISDPAFDLEWSLGYVFDDAKRRSGGRRLYSHRPKRRRGEGGVILNAAGEPVFENGKPAKNWDHPSAVPILADGKEEMELNQAALQEATVFDPEARRRLAYGLKRQEHNGHRSEERKNADRLLEAKEKAGQLVIKRGQTDQKTGKRGWRLLEPYPG